MGGSLIGPLRASPNLALMIENLLPMESRLSILKERKMVRRPRLTRHIKTMSALNSKKRKVKGRRKVLFILVIVLVFLGLLEAGARIAEHVLRSRRMAAFHGANPDLVPVDFAPVFEKHVKGGEEVYRRTPYHWIMKGQEFKAAKAPADLRVFCLGGSAANGWPHVRKHTYPLYLHIKLRDLMPIRHVEVINAAGKCHASFRVKAVFDEIIEYEPDLVIIYSGNNEFLEDFVFAVPPGDEAGHTSDVWYHSALLRLIRRAAGILVDKEDLASQASAIGEYGLREHGIDRIRFAFRQASRRKTDPEQLNATSALFRHNIESMVKECLERGVAVLLLNVPVNLKDWIPNVSIHDPGCKGEKRQKWHTAFRKGLTRWEGGDLEGAVKYLEEAIDLDPGYAASHFYLGKALHGLGRFEEAKEHFLQALEHDAFPFRCLPRFNAILRDVAEQFGVPLVDVASALEETFTPDGIIGMDALVDYVHPTAAANEVIAHTIFSALVDQGFVDRPAGFPLAAYRCEVPGGVEEELRVLQPLYAQSLVMGQYDKLEGIAEKLKAKYQRALTSLPDKERELCRGYLARLKKSLIAIKPYRRLVRAQELGIVAQKYTPEETSLILDDYVRMIRETEGRLLTDEEFDRLVSMIKEGKD